MSKKILSIVSAEYLHDYLIQIHFADGVKKDVDFSGFLNSSTNPHIREFLNHEKFKTFKILNGQLMWGDFELIFPITDLYSGKISA